MSKFKVTVYSFKTTKDLKTLKDMYGSLGIDLMYDADNNCVKHATQAFFEFREWMKVYRKKFICNVGDVVNSIIIWCEENNVECEVITCSDGDIRVSPVVDGYLTNWTYGWYLPDQE